MYATCICRALGLSGYRKLQTIPNSLESKVKTLKNENEHDINCSEIFVEN